jgi:hypothetical protein
MGMISRPASRSRNEKRVLAKGSINFATSVFSLKRKCIAASANAIPQFAPATSMAKSSSSRIVESGASTSTPKRNSQNLIFLSFATGVRSREHRVRPRLPDLVGTYGACIQQLIQRQLTVALRRYEAAGRVPALVPQVVGVEARVVLQRLSDDRLDRYSCTKNSLSLTY